MAKIETKTKTVVERVVLDLSVEEANAVARVLGATAGSAQEIERVWTALSDNGFTGEGFQTSKTGQFRIDPIHNW